MVRVDTVPNTHKIFVRFDRKDTFVYVYWEGYIMRFILDLFFLHFFSKPISFKPILF